MHMEDIHVFVKACQKMNSLTFSKLKIILIICLLLSILMIPINFVINRFYKNIGVDIILYIQILSAIFAYFFSLIVILKKNIFKNKYINFGFCTLFTLLEIQAVYFASGKLVNFPSISAFIEPFCDINSAPTLDIYFKCGGANTVWWLLFHIYNWVIAYLFISLFACFLI